MTLLQKMFFVFVFTLTLSSLGSAAVPEQPTQLQSPATEAKATLDGTAVKGVVRETMNVAGYTYLLVDGAKGKNWVAIPETSVTVGQEVSCAPGMTMQQFQSKTLQRTFDTIVFSPGLEKAPAATAPSPVANTSSDKGGASFNQALQAEHSGSKGNTTTTAGSDPAAEKSAGSAGAIVPSANVNVNKAPGENSYSVSECFERAKELDGKTIRVRGKVMKISRMIMGKNWLHLQDGTGDPVKNQHDLVVTTTEDPGENTVVTIEGVLTANRDFGAGYKYEAIVENAKVETK